MNKNEMINPVYYHQKDSEVPDNKDLKKWKPTSAFKVKYIDTKKLPLAPKPKVRNSILFWPDDV